HRVEVRFRRIETRQRPGTHAEHARELFVGQAELGLEGEGRSGGQSLANPGDPFGGGGGLGSEEVPHDREEYAKWHKMSNRGGLGSKPYRGTNGASIPVAGIVKRVGSPTVSH